MAALRRTIERRLASETGAVRKEHGGRLRVCLVYPNTYHVGMSSLGFQTIYHWMNEEGGVVCERAFVPEADDLAELERRGEALVSYESQTPLHDFDVVAFSVSYELDYVNVARVLRLAKVPVMAAQREANHPLVMAGGAAVSINPQPLADLVDLFAIGEGEEMVGELAEAMRGAGGRAAALARAGKVEGVWVAESGGDGKILRLRPPPREASADFAQDDRKRGVPPREASADFAQDDRKRGAGEFAGDERGRRGGSFVPSGVVRRYVAGLADWPTRSRLLTRETEFGELYLVEMSRGCGRGCKFCVTPACYWPLRWREGSAIMTMVREGLKRRKAIGLVGAAVSDHPNIDEVAEGIVGAGARLSVSSLRADSVSDRLLGALARSGSRSITLAPEAGSERLRSEIGKPIADDEIVDTLARAAAVGMREAKLYFMVGLPGEEEREVAAIAGFARRCMKEAGLSRMTVAAGAFVPKPDTPYEREGMLPVRELSRRLRVIREGLRRERGVRLAVESANWSYLEGALSRGDRRLGRVIARAEEMGGKLAAWRKAFREAGLGMEEFAGD